MLALNTPAMAKREAFKASGTLSIITAFNEAITAESILLKAGYSQRGLSFKHPGSESGNYSATINPETGRVHTLSTSTSDPLYVEGSKSGHDAFSAFKVLFHDGDERAAMIDAGDNLLAIGGVAWNKAKQVDYAKAQDNNAGSTQNERADSPGLNLRPMSELKMKAIKWLWSGWIPKGYVTLWAGGEWRG